MSANSGLKAIPCAVCYAPFKPRSGRHSACSDTCVTLRKCKIALNGLINPASTTCTPIKLPESVAPSLRKAPQLRECIECGGPFEAKTRRSTFCSPMCRSASQKARRELLRSFSGLPSSMDAAQILKDVPASTLRSSDYYRGRHQQFADTAFILRTARDQVIETVKARNLPAPELATIVKLINTHFAVPDAVTVDDALQAQTVLALSRSLQRVNLDRVTAQRQPVEAGTRFKVPDVGGFVAEMVEGADSVRTVPAPASTGQERLDPWLGLDPFELDPHGEMTGAALGLQPDALPGQVAAALAASRARALGKSAGDDFDPLSGFLELSAADLY